ncbi:hypothetical protein [Streptomyces sp. NBC_00572]|uniref:hypothetical protein n=1 Tax=Streptomyces sp. NBC_00572 TaxID=2903664 RepID=UPI00225BB1EA|nr:hypothetical protein [Streptomyces sp. NBC_00572]MCX4981046.1 hypothetical protein [Streptomyces sp. NBC_00572]
MPAPSTAAGQTSAAPTAVLTMPRGRRRAPVLGPAAPAAPDPGHGPGAAGAVPRAGAGAGAADQADDVVRWAVFCCVLVPVVLVVYGSSLGGAAGTALGLVAVTAACRVLLRRSERGLRGEPVRSRRRG